MSGASGQCREEIESGTGTAVATGRRMHTSTVVRTAASPWCCGGDVR
jgi:hypothetical protein